MLKGEAFCTVRKMGIQVKRFIRRNVYFVVVFFLLLSRVAKGVESKWEEQEPLLAYLISSGDINEEMAELLLINCRLELLHSKRTLQDLELDSDDLFRNTLSRRKARDMALEIKQILVDCLRRKNIVQYSPKERELTQTFGEETVNPGYSPREENESPGSASDVQSSTHKTLIIAVTVTASGSFVVALLLFFCCHKYCGTGSGRSRNDESPLLSLRMSDYSIASSLKSHSLGALESEEKLGHQSFNNKSNAGGNFHMDLHSLSNSRTEIGASLNSVNNLPLPPGMKPPPGRTNLPKPPMNIEVPPPPPAGIPPRPPPGPPPPPPVKPLSGGPCPAAPGPPPPPPISSGIKGGPQPPPPPRVGAIPPRPPPVGLKPPRPGTSMDQGDDGGAKAKLKPFFWDKVSAGADQSMVWHQIKAGSFQFNEEMMESLFGYAPAGKNKNEAKKESSSQEPQFIQIIDPKKAQNLSILLKALNVTTEEVCDALEEGNELPSELIQTLLKMAPRAEEELKLRLYSGNLSLLGPAERFLKRLVDIPFAFKRLESLLFMCTLQEETSTLRESFVVLGAACTELRKSRLFHKLLEAVLKTGNRMNDGTFRGGAQAFKLDTLLKLSDVRGADGKTTLLHFVVQEIIRSEGIRAARAAREMRSMSSFKSEDLHHDSTQHSDEQLRSLGLQVVSSLSNELENVKRAAILDADSLTGTVAKLGESLIRAKTSLNSDMKDVAEDNGFHQTLKSFVENAEVEIMQLLEEENKTMELVKVTADYFHGHSGRDEGLRLFAVVRDFLIILDKVCREVKNTPRNVNKTQNKEDLVATPSDPRQTTTDPRQRLFPAIADRRVDSSSSDDEVDNSSSEDEK